MQIVLSGGSGLIGQALEANFKDRLWNVKKLVRRLPFAGEECAFWDPFQGQLDPAVLTGADAVINLSGENIFAHRWNMKVKQKILQSRIQITRLLVEAMGKMSRPPKVFLNASAIGYYGDRGDEWLTEESPAGDNFLANVCCEWEKEALRAEQMGIRVVCLRFGAVLSSKGGALKQMLLPFKLGLGGEIGSGKQYMSWVALYEVEKIVSYILEHSELHGPLNVVSPNPVTNLEFTKVLGAILHRPTFVSMPAFLAKLAFGEMADEVVLASARVAPAKLTQSGYQFETPLLQEALKRYLIQNQ